MWEKAWEWLDILGRLNFLWGLIMAAKSKLNGVVRFLSKREPSGVEGVSQPREDSHGGLQTGRDITVGGDFAGRDIDKSIHITQTKLIAQPISPVLDGVVRGPNIFMKIQNTDSQPHQFKVVFHDVTGAAGNRRVRSMWLPWNCSDFQMIGPQQSGMIQVAQADGEDRNVGKVIRFIHDKGRQYDGRLSEYVAFDGKLYFVLELQSDAELDFRGHRTWTLEVDNNGTPVRFSSL